MGGACEQRRDITCDGLVSLPGKVVMQYPQALVASCYEKPEFLLLNESLLGVPSGTVADTALP